MNEETSLRKPPDPEEQEKIRSEAAWVDLLRQEIGQVIVGQKYLVDRLILGLLANGHVLLRMDRFFLRFGPDFPLLLCVERKNNKLLQITAKQVRKK